MRSAEQRGGNEVREGMRALWMPKFFCSYVNNWVDIISLELI